MQQNQYAEQHSSIYVEGDKFYTVDRKTFNPSRDIEPLKEVAAFFRKVDKFQKLGVDGVHTLQQILKNPPKKAKRAAKPKESKITGAVIRHQIEIVMDKFPGWQTVKKLRTLNLKWNPKSKTYTGPYSIQLINQIQEVLA